MIDDMIIDAVLGRQLGSGHSMPSKKSRRSLSSNQSGQFDDAQDIEAVRTSMSSMQGQIDFLMNRNQTLERIVATMVGWLGIDASELAPLHMHDAGSTHPSRNTSGQGSILGEDNEDDDIDDP